MNFIFTFLFYNFVPEMKKKVGFLLSDVKEISLYYIFFHFTHCGHGKKKAFQHVKINLLILPFTQFHTRTYFFTKMFFHFFYLFIYLFNFFISTILCMK